MADYFLIDSGKGEKLEQFGSFSVIRPCPIAVWERQLPQSVWEEASLSFSRDGGNKWSHARLPDEWVITLGGVKLKMSTTDFGHLGVFPEHSLFWETIREQILFKKRCSLLNLFAYSGGATLAAAQAGATVCHVDSSKGMIEWARENARINQLDKAPIRWIVDDVVKFVMREIRRGNRYDAILLDPPSFGRGVSGEVFKIERDLLPLLQKCQQLLSDNPLFILLSCHTPGFTPDILRFLLNQTVTQKGRVEEGEMFLKGSSKIFSIPSGVYAQWIAE